MAKQLRNSRIDLRISEQEKDKFIGLCADHDRPWPDMLREMIEAFNNQKLQILVPKSKLNLMKGIHKCQ